ncbi:PRD domain-containing protein, partial [Enterococcus faecium]
AYRCVEKISLYLNENYDYQVSNEERLYLTIHIARIVQTTEQ